MLLNVSIILCAMCLIDCQPLNVDSMMKERETFVEDHDDGNSFVHPQSFVNLDNTRFSENRNLETFASAIATKVSRPKREVMSTVALVGMIFALWGASTLEFMRTHPLHEIKDASSNDKQKVTA